MRKRLIAVVLLMFMVLGVFAVPVQAASLIDITITGRCDYSSARQIADLTISRRVKDGGSRLNYNKNLTEAAMHRAAEVAFYYSHIRPSGGRYYEVLKMYHKGAYYHGENIAIQMGSAESVTNAWFASEGHRNNIMNKNFTQIGVGVYSSGGITAYVQLLSDSKKDTEKTVKNGYENKKYDISTEPSHLLRYTYDLEESYEMSLNDRKIFNLRFVNDGYRYATCSLVPVTLDIKDSAGRVIARLVERTDTSGYYTIVPQMVGTGTASIGAFKGDSNPTFLTVKVKDHEHQYRPVVTNPTCKEQGYTTYTCNICGDSYKADYTEKISHITSDYISVDHDHHKSCCIMCGREDLEAHDMRSTFIPSTCTKQGYTESICKKCGYSYKSNYVDMIEHSWDKGVIFVEPTYTKPGSMLYKCINCSAEKTEPVKKKDNPFIDVHEDSYYYKPVMWAVDNGITTGTSFERFGPEDTCTRAQAVTFLWRAAGQPKPAAVNNPFNDIKRSDYYYEAVLWAVENGITKGTSINTFSPDDYCTRGQIVTFLWRANDEVRVSSDNPFRDVSKVDYFYDAVLWAVDYGITNGLSNNRFGPEENCTRGQIVTFLYRTIG